MMFADAHNDTLTKAFFNKESLEENTCQFDIKRASSVGLNLQYMAIWQDTRTKDIDFFSNICHILEYVNRYDINNIAFSGTIMDDKLNVMISIEDISFVEDLSLIEELRSKGVMSVTLSWNHKNFLCGGAFEDDVLSQFGIDALKRLQKHNFIIDLAHMGRKSFFEAVKYLDYPFIVSHSNCFSLCQNPRNITDEQIKIVKKFNGIIGINFYSEFLNQNGATIEDVAKHIMYISELIGHEHVCLGSDFDGADAYPDGLQDVEDLPRLMYILEKYGFSRKEIEDICFMNLKKFTMKFLE